MQSKLFTALTAGVLCVLGGYALLAVFAGFSSLTVIPPILHVPGSFLAESFSWTAFYVPVYLFLAALLLYIPGFRRELVGVLSFTILPFLTISLFLKLLFADSSATITDFMTNAFGQKGGAFLLLLLFILELLVMFRLWNAVDREPSSREEQDRKAKEDSDRSEGFDTESRNSEGGRRNGADREHSGPLSGFARRALVLLEAPDRDSEDGFNERSTFDEARLNADPSEEEPNGFEFPDLPPLGELKTIRSMSHDDFPAWKSDASGAEATLEEPP